MLWRVTLPLVAPGLAAAFCLVFLEAVTELTATLVLIPTGVQTLATQFWAYQTNLVLRPGRAVRRRDDARRRGPERACSGAGSTALPSRRRAAA